MKIKRTLEERVIIVFAVTISLILAFVTAYPIYYSFIFALSHGREAGMRQIFFWPVSPTLENFRMVFNDPLIFPSFVMNVLRTGVGVVTGVFFTAMVGYALTREDLRYRRVYSIAAIITMYFSGGVIPTFLVYRALMVTNTFWVFILPAMLNVFHMLLVMAFFRDLPDSLFESAKIDGAGEFKIFRSIALPLSKPILATIALFVGVGHWNDWFTPAFFTSNPNLQTLPVILMRLLSATEAQARINESIAHLGVVHVTNAGLTVESLRHATMIISILPIMFVYPFLRKFFEKGIMIGSIKA